MRNKRVWQAGLGVALVGMLAGCFGNGVNYVGAKRGQVKPGLYTSNTPYGGNCFIFRGATGFQPVGASAAPLGGRTFIQVLTTDYALVSTGCGLWVTPQAGSYNPDRATAKTGSYRIPTDLLPGTYTAPGGPQCSWIRVSSWEGVAGSAAAKSVIERSPAGVTQAKVVIAKTDAGFVTGSCGGWTRSP